MIEIFKTNITEVNEAKIITQKLLEYHPLSKIDFDLEDCDKTLRIESRFIDISKVIRILNENDFLCEILI